MPKQLAIISSDKILEDLCKQILEINAQEADKIGFLQRKSEQIHTEMKALRDPIWDQIIERIQQHGTLPADFTRERYMLQFSMSQNSLFVETVEEYNARINSRTILVGPFPAPA